MSSVYNKPAILPLVFHSVTDATLGFLNTSTWSHSPRVLLSPPVAGKPVGSAPFLLNPTSQLESPD